MASTFTRAAKAAGSLWLGCLVFAATANAETLRVGGTGAATELLRQLGTTFSKQSGVGFEVVPSLGSTGAIGALVDGVLDLAVVGRPLKPEESAKGAALAFTTRTPFILASSHRRPNGMKVAEIAEAFRSESAAWSDGTPIRVILRPRSESDTALMGQLFPGLASAIESARRHADVPTAPTDQDNAELAERTPGSLTGSTSAQIKLEGRNLRMIAIDGVEPTIENFAAGIYPYGKTLYFVLAAKKSSLIERFVEFIRSPEGHKVLREANCL